MIQRFAIYSPTLGDREDFPSILLENVYTPDGSNVQIWNGEIRKAKLRNKELVRKQYTISSINTTNNSITIAGNHVTEFLNGDTVTVYKWNSTADQYDYTQLTMNTTSTHVGDVTTITVSDDIDNSTNVSIVQAGSYIFKDENTASNNPNETDFLKVTTPDSNPILRYETLTLSVTSERLVAFTKAHAYYWNSTLTQWDLIFTCSGDTTYWDSDIYGDNIIATNNVDRPIYWDGDTSGEFENLDTLISSSVYISKARFIKTYRNYIFLGYVSLSSGESYQHYVYTSNIGEGVAANGFRQDLNGDAGAYLIDGNGEISGGFAVWQGYLIVFKHNSIRKLWFIGGSIPFEQDNYNSAIGCIAAGSVVNDEEDRCYYYASDQTFRELSLGIISYAKDKTARNINPELVENIRAVYVKKYNEIRWSVPHGHTATSNNKMLIYRNRSWDNDIDINVTAFGVYTRQEAWTWDTLPFASWNQWGWDTWDEVDANTSLPTEICGDADGCTYELTGSYYDDDIEYTSYFVLTTDLADKKALPYFKRILWMYLYFQNSESGNMTVSIKRDNEKSWQTVGAISLSGTNKEEIIRKKLNVDMRGRHFLIKISGTPFFCFIGAEFEYIPSGAR